MIRRLSKPIAKVSPKKRARSGKPGKCGIIRLYGKAKTALRRECYARDNERCVVCKAWLPFEGSLMTRMHMAHIIGLGRGGSDVISNVETRCYQHHIIDQHTPKVVPPKGDPR